MKTIVITFFVTIGISIVSFGQSSGRITIDISSAKKEYEIRLQKQIENIISSIDEINSHKNDSVSTEYDMLVRQTKVKIEDIKMERDKFYNEIDTPITEGNDKLNHRITELENTLKAMEDNKAAVKLVLDKIDEAGRLQQQIGKMETEIKKQRDSINTLSSSNQAYRHSIAAIKDSTKFGPWGIGLAIGLNVDLYSDIQYKVIENGHIREIYGGHNVSGMLSAIAYYKFEKIPWRLLLNFPLTQILGSDIKSFYNYKINLGFGGAYDLSKNKEKKGVSVFLIVNIANQKRLNMAFYEGSVFEETIGSKLDISKYETINKWTPSLYFGVCYPF